MAWCRQNATRSRREALDLTFTSPWRAYGRFTAGAILSSIIYGNEIVVAGGGSSAEFMCVASRCLSVGCLGWV